MALGLLPTQVGITIFNLILFFKNFKYNTNLFDCLQDDLAHDDIMILDSGVQVFLWMGPRCSEVEVKLSYKSAQVYIQNLRAKQPERPRKLFLTIMGKVSILLKYIEVLLRYFLLFNSKYFNFKYNVFFFLIPGEQTVYSMFSWLESCQICT